MTYSVISVSWSAVCAIQERTRIYSAKLLVSFRTYILWLS